jgi:hypothetical protein
VLAVSPAGAPRADRALILIKPFEIKKLTFISIENILSIRSEPPHEQHADSPQGVCIGID